MRELRFVILWLILGWTLVGLVVFFSVITSPPETLGLLGGDKLLHFSTYAVIMVWFGLIYLPGRAYLNLGVGFIMMGIVLEFIQGVTGYRSLEYFDMIANAIGVSIGWLLAKTRLSYALTNMESWLAK